MKLPAQLGANVVLEQFRIFHAALRLGQFTSRQLADASGVATGTVQKTLRRRRDIFVSVKGPPTKRRGGQGLLHTVRDDVLRFALQQAADAVEMPPLPTKNTGEPLGLILAEETLCDVFPRAEPHERPPLLSAAAMNLDLAGSSHAETVGEFRQLAEALSVLVNARIRLLKPELSQARSTARDASLAAIESLLSLKERNRRDEESSHRERTATALASLPSELATACQSAEIDEVLAQWWTDVVASEWILLSHRRWQAVVGDVVADVVAAERARKEKMEVVTAEAKADEQKGSGAATAKIVSEQRRPAMGPVPVFPPGALTKLTVNLQEPRQEGRPYQGLLNVGRLAGRHLWGRILISRMKDPKAKFVRGVRRAPDFFGSGEQHSGIKVTIGAQDFAVYDEKQYARRLLYAGGLNKLDSKAIGTIAALELDFINHAVSSVTLDTGPGVGGSIFIPYVDMHLVHPFDGDYTRYTWTVDASELGRSMSSFDPADDIRAILGPNRLGSAQWFDFQNMRILLRPGHQIEVWDGSPQSHYLRLGEGSGKIGDVVAILVHVESGTLNAAIIKMADRQELLQPVSFSTLQYRPDEQRFLVTVPDIERSWPYMPLAQQSGRYREAE